MMRKGTWILRTAPAVLLLVLSAAVAPSDSVIADAAMNGDRDSIRELLRAGFDVNAAQPDGMTALHWAADRNDATIAEILLYAGAKHTAKTRIAGHTPLMVASRHGHAEVITVLLEAGADANVRSTAGGTTPLHFAAASGSVATIEALIRHGAEVDAQEVSNGHTPLMFAAAYNQPGSVEALIAAGADPGLKNHSLELGPRQEEERQLQDLRNQRVVYSRQVRAQEERVSRGLEAEEVRPNGLEPVYPPPPQEEEEEEDPQAEEDPAPEEEPDLQPGDGEQEESDSAAGPEEALSRQDSLQAAARAAEEEDEEMVRPLNYAETVGGYGGFSALHLASRDGNRAAVKALLAGGSDIDQRSDGDGSTPLLIATINGHWDLAMELLDLGANPNLASDHGATPLYGVINLQWAPHSFYPQPTGHHNSSVTYLEAMERLLEAGADPNARLERHLWYMAYNFNLLGVDTQGATPFWRAAYGTDVRAMRLLMEYGADPTIRTRVPPQRAARGGASDETDPSGLPPARTGDPSLTALHAATGAGYGQGRAGNQHRHVPGGWMPAARYLIEELGMDVDARDHQGYTALHNAASRGDVEMIEYLVAQGADVSVVSRRGQTTADMANGPVQRISPFPAAINLLVSLGAVNNDNCVSC
jgi:uncharacterized protein